MWEYANNYTTAMHITWVAHKYYFNLWPISSRWFFNCNWYVLLFYFSFLSEEHSLFSVKFCPSCLKMCLLIGYFNIFRGGVLSLWCLMPLSTIFQLYRGNQFYWWRKPEYLGNTTCRKSLTNLITLMLYQVQLTWVGFKVTMLVVIGTDYIWLIDV